MFSKNKKIEGKLLQKKKFNLLTPKDLATTSELGRNVK